MPEVRFEGLVGQSYHLRNVDYDCQRTINWYPEVNETGLGKNAESSQLVPTPGLFKVIDAQENEGISRGGYVASNGFLYWMFGTELYIIQTDGTKEGFRKSVVLGGNFTFTDDDPVARFTDNGIDLFVLSGGNHWAVNLQSSLSSNLNNNPDDAFNPATSITFLDGYIVYSQKNSNQFFWTDLYSRSADALNFASAESNPDELVAVINNNLDLWLFGNKTTEIWYNLGQEDIVFSRRGNTLIETGCAAANTVKKINSTIAWLASDDRGGPIMVVANGYSPQRISTYALEQVWNTYSQEQLKAANGYVYQEGGHHFYVLNIPGADSTWVYDMTVSTQLGVPVWHERRYFDGEVFSAQGVNSHVFYEGFHIVGSDPREPNGKIFVLDNDSFTDDGDPIIRERTTPHVTESMNRMFYHSMTLDFYTGITEDLLLDPQVMLQYSDDGGHTWSNEVWTSAGKTGDYGLKVQFHRLGMARNRVFRIRVSDPLYWALSGAAVNIQAGVH